MIIKWFNKRIKPFGYQVDILDAAKGCKDGIPFNALIESQKSQIGTFDVANLPKVRSITYCSEQRIEFAIG